MRLYDYAKRVVSSNAPNDTKTYKMKQLIIILLLEVLLFPSNGIGQNTSYSTPQNTYAGSAVNETKDLNRTAFDQYNTNKGNYNNVVNSLNAKIIETNAEGDKEAIKFALGEFNKALKKYIDGGNWQDAYYDIEIAKNKINENYNTYLEKSMANFIAETTKKNTQTAKNYFQSGISKEDLKDYQGAIQDYTKAIELDPKNEWAYNNRGRAKSYLYDYYGSIKDYTTAIELNPKYADAYIGRGLSKLLLNRKDKEGACTDWSRAGELGNSDAYSLINKNCKQ
jgi:tetratricopeptide (TPR) repeat protein